MKTIIALWLSFLAFSQAAELKFKELTQDVNAPADARTVTADFSFTNDTGKPVTISKSDPGCSCLKVEISGGKLKYGPGESGTLRATFDLGNFSGTVDKVIGLWLDDDSSATPTMRLTVRIHIPVLVVMEPAKTLSWTVGEKPAPQTIHIRMAEGESIRVTGVKSSSPNFVCEIKTVEEGKKYDLVVSPQDTATPGMTVIRVETDCKVDKHKTQQAFGVVRKASAQAATNP
ncbi:DUF1573 domain-containing protein [Luteolibacter yonseiensis]|uniref:DUF1573 domain-containing protein n=1 Tax=Luteolibacter yonseiensis TaxID=1144680 RepID=A0A934R4D5_9BACT|nr:DUF1573 domain-containing protein [Luteolibacter yonseiensis]MBK1816689.1 DUF1573 domain-containing protein [Luteolibacter yonseiensis]